MRHRDDTKTVNSKSVFSSWVKMRKRKWPLKAFYGRNGTKKKNSSKRTIWFYFTDNPGTGHGRTIQYVRPLRTVVHIVPRFQGFRAFSLRRAIAGMCVPKSTNDFPSTRTTGTDNANRTIAMAWACPHTRPINDYLYFAKISMAPLNCIFNVYINCLQHKYTEIPLSIFFNPLVPRRFCTLETVVISFIFIHIAFPLKKYSNSIWIFTKFKILQALSLVGIRFFGYYNMYGYQIDKADSVCPET